MPQEHTLSLTLVSTHAYMIEVNAERAPGPPVFTLAWQEDTSLNETRDRVHAAITNAGYDLPPSRITITLSPAISPYIGTGFDLAIGVTLLAATGALPNETLHRFVHIGELGPDGQVLPVQGILPAALTAVRSGQPDIAVAPENAQEARLVPGARIWPVRDLHEVVLLHRGEMPLPDADLTAVAPDSASAPGTVVPRLRREHGDLDLADLPWHDERRRALVIAAAGGHHLLLTGPPGTGAPTLAARLPGLLPDLEDDQAVEVTAVHRLAGTVTAGGGLIHRPPFESAQHTSSILRLIGGSRGTLRLGVASLAHRGVLLLEDIPEFSVGVLDALQRPLETGAVLIQEARGRALFPARFQLVLTSRPCPCGRFQAGGSDCTCSPALRRRYLSRIPQWLLDRVDLQIELGTGSLTALPGPADGEDSARVAARVAAARDLQRERLAATAWELNRDVPGDWLRGPLKLRRSVTRDLDHACDDGLLLRAGYDQVLRIAWTLSDLAGRSRPGREDIAQALTLRLG